MKSKFNYRQTDRDKNSFIYRFTVLLLILMFLFSLASCFKMDESSVSTINNSLYAPNASPIDMRIMSFNIRYSEFTPKRIDRVIHMVKTYKPDSVGFQEATDEWVETLAERLGDEYDYISCGRNADKTGEATSVFYLKSRFKLIKSDTKWLSNTPDVAGSKVKESSLPRIFTYVVLEEIDTGKQFAHINTHLEHTSEKARLAQAKILLKYIKNFKSEKMPYVLTGDFNTNMGSTSYKKLEKGGLTNCSDIAKSAEPGCTFHGYGTTASTIDFIFVDESTTTVDFYKVCDDTFLSEYGAVTYPSDHNPIIADIRMGGYK